MFHSTSKSWAMSFIARFCFLSGPTVFILDSFVLGLGDYFTNFVQYSLRLTPYSGDTWVRDWTIFYLS
uniref:Uncharacterized protein n=1 Tax=Virgibacillus oceani TaxID=1479511 RepID=A0A917LYS4_9BACI|nr:hypothetical protein GCM10011398_08010 [Virgibacillus oceani]